MSDEWQIEETGDRSTPIDDCWNRIGITGDRSCERLAGHVHCRNCNVYAEAAVAILERYAPQREAMPDQPPAGVEDAVHRRSFLVFRVRDEWLALATSRLLEVASLAPVHSLPHQRSGSTLGVTNVRGTLAATVSIAELLGLQGGGREGPERRVVPMMLVLDGEGGALAAPVDEVGGIEAIPTVRVVEAGGEDGTARHFARGVVNWRGRSITLLDTDELIRAMVRSLA